jgi:hypothetical protein
MLRVDADIAYVRFHRHRRNVGKPATWERGYGQGRMKRPTLLRNLPIGRQLPRAHTVPLVRSSSGYHTYATRCITRAAPCIICAMVCHECATSCLTCLTSCCTCAAVSLTRGLLHSEVNRRIYNDHTAYVVVCGDGCRGANPPVDSSSSSYYHPLAPIQRLGGLGRTRPCPAMFLMRTWPFL